MRLCLRSQLRPLANAVAAVAAVLPAAMLLQPTSRPDVGRAIDIAAETVHKAGVIFVASAGNAGGWPDACAGSGLAPEVDV
jgi:hypothetical protein